MSAKEAKSLLAAASAIQSAVNESGLGAITEESTPITLYDRVITHRAIRDATRDLYRDGYYALAVEQCFKRLNNVVKQLSKSDKDGAGLMHQAFSSTPPLIRLNDLVTQSEKDEQAGYALIMAGCMTGVRNPRAHEDEFADEPRRALELLTLGQHLMDSLDQAVATPRGAPAAPP